MTNKELLYKAMSVADKEKANELIKEFLFLNEPKGSCKFNIRDFCGKDDLRQLLMGVYHDKGYLISTDGICLAVVRSTYDESREGKIIGKAGNEIVGIYPNYKRIRPEVSELTPIKFDFEKLGELLKKVKIANKSGELTAVKIDGGTYGLEVLVKLVKFSSLKRLRFYIKDSRTIAGVLTYDIYAENCFGEWGLFCGGVFENYLVYD